MPGWQNLTERLYQESAFVPPIRQRLRAIFDAQDDWYGTSVGFYAVEDDRGNLLARSTVQHNDSFDAKLGARVQLFGFTEFVESYEVFETLMAGIEAIGRENGRTSLLGPANLLPNEYGGVITSGFHERGFLDTAYNPPYYPEFYASRGFERRFASATYICASLRTGPDPDSILRFDDTRMAAERLEIHYGDRKRFAAQVRLLLAMLNASFSVRPYYTEIAPEEMSKRMEGLDYVLDERLLIYLTRAGEPVAFIICVPDISSFVATVRGNLNAFNQIALAAIHRKYRREAIVIVGGAIPGCEATGYFRLLMRQLFRNLKAAGYDAVRATSVENDNPAARSAFVRMGGRKLHELTYYVRRL